MQKYLIAGLLGFLFGARGFQRHWWGTGGLRRGHLVCSAVRLRRRRLGHDHALRGDVLGAGLIGLGAGWRLCRGGFGWLPL